MPRQEFPDFSKKSIRSDQFFRELPAIVGNMALNFFDDSFKRQGFIDKSYSRWKPRADKRVQGRKILVKTGRLRRSLRMRTQGNRITIFTDVPYAAAHNEGANIKQTVTVRAHTRRTPNGNRITINSHNRNVNTNIPKRQFMGHSDLLDRRMVKHVSRALDQIF